MNLTFIHLAPFSNRWKKFGLNDGDLQALETQLMREPEAGVLMQGTGGLRKVRFAPPSRHSGKSGAYRVGYIYVRVAGTIYLVAIFPKASQTNFTMAEKAYFKTLIRSL